MKKPVYLSERIEARLSDGSMVVCPQGERVYIEHQDEDGSVSFRAGYPGNVKLFYLGRLPLMERTGTYSVVFVGSMLGTGVYAGPGLTKQEAATEVTAAARVHGLQNVAVEPDYRVVQ